MTTTTATVTTILSPLSIDNHLPCIFTTFVRLRLLAFYNTNNNKKIHKYRALMIDLANIDSTTYVFFSSSSSFPSLSPYIFPCFFFLPVSPVHIIFIKFNIHLNNIRFYTQNLTNLCLLLFYAFFTPTFLILRSRLRWSLGWKKKKILTFITLKTPLWLGQLRSDLSYLPADCRDGGGGVEHDNPQCPRLFLFCHWWPKKRSVSPYIYYQS